MNNAIPPEASDAIIPATSLGLSRLGWIAPTKAVSFDQWLGILDAAASVERASPWWIGDLVNYAMAQGKEFEERAFQAMPYKDQTLRNYAVIARLFPPTQRRGNLTIRHHAAVAKIARKDMAKAQFWLEQAETNEMSAAELAEQSTETPRQAIAAPETPDGLLASEGEAAGGQDSTILREALESMVWQFAHQCQKDGRPALGTMGLSALEGAFDALGWDDPYPTPDMACQVGECNDWATCGTPTDDGYRRVCGKHMSEITALRANPQGS